MTKRHAILIAVVLVLASASILTMTMVRSAGGVRTLSAAEIRRIVEAPARCTYSASGEMMACYNGRFVRSAVAIYHRSPNKHRIEYLTPPLKGIAMVDDGRASWRIDPRVRAVVALESGGCGRPESRLQLLSANYRVQQTGRDHVAGRPAQVLAVRSQSGGIRKRLWVDEKTFIVLRSQDIAPGGGIISYTSFKSISYSVAIPDVFFKRPKNMPASNCLQGPGKPMTRDELSRAVGFAVRLPAYIPLGFKLDAYRLYECPCGCGHKSAYLRYTNGLDSISLFETPANSGCAKMGSCKPRDGHSGDHTAMVTVRGTSYVVMGDVNGRDLVKIADSVR